MLARVAFDHRSIDRVLNETSIAEPDRALAHEIVYGCARHYFSLAGEARDRLHTPLKARDAIVLSLLIVGLYQLRHLRIPPYAAVNETVAAASEIGRPWARGLVNHVLRRAASEEPPPARTEERILDHPDWLIRMLQHDLPDRWRTVLDTSLTRAPLSLRVNLARIERRVYIDELAAAGVASEVAEFDEGLFLREPIPVAQLPGYADGLVSVQDLSAMWPAHLLRATGPERVLDACAAPGGKAVHLIERDPHIALTAVDIDEQRCTTLRSECARCGVDPDIVVCGDATRLDWWDGRPYDAILLDAPCSGTGTLRRHPDIKLLKREADIAQYQRLQTALLTNLWSALAPGGRLLYCTCSVLSAENDSPVGGLVEQDSRARVQPLAIPGSIETRYGRQLLPRIGGGDGFYFASIGKERVG